MVNYFLWRAVVFQEIFWKKISRKTTALHCIFCKELKQPKLEPFSKKTPFPHFSSQKTRYFWRNQTSLNIESGRLL